MSELVFGNFRRCSPVVEQIGWGQQNQKLKGSLSNPVHFALLFL